MKAQVIKATINFLVKWRVYYGGELIATFETEQSAKAYAEWIDEQQ